jgi:hypothetical protein
VPQPITLPRCPLGFIEGLVCNVGKGAYIGLKFASAVFILSLTRTTESSVPNLSTVKERYKKLPETEYSF